MELISDNTKTSLKQRIESSFLVCVVNMSLIKSMMYNHKAGNLFKAFDEFKEGFDELFCMSSNNEKLNKDIVKNVDAWLNKSTPCTPKIVVEGLKLFSQYKSELFRQNIIKV